MRAIYSVDLSKAKKLKEVAFQFWDFEVAWIIQVLRTITLEHKVLQEISIHIVPQYGKSGDIKFAVKKCIYPEWADLDDTLLNICQSRACHVKVVVHGQKERESQIQKYIKAAQECMVHLLPKVTKEGLISVVYSKHQPLKKGNCPCLW